MSSEIDKPLKHAMFIAQHLCHCDYSTIVTLILYELGVAPRNDGFICLKKAIGMRHESPTRHFENDIYFELSLELDGVEDNDRIEQAIRRAIRDAWKERDEEVWGMLFPRARSGIIEKPSNSDFITRVAWFIELWEGCCKEASYAKQ